MAVNFDTHAAVKRLGEAGFDERQAEALVAAIAEAQRHADLPTRSDLHDTAATLRQEVNNRQLKQAAFNCIMRNNSSNNLR